MSKRESINPQEPFTIDEAQTATLINTEGYFGCWYKTRKGRRYTYPGIRIGMCDKEALLPAQRVFGTKIIHARTKYIECPPELFPPDGKGRYLIGTTGTRAHQTIKRLAPLITQYKHKQWQQTVEKCRP